MTSRVSIVFLSLFLLFTPQIHAKNKKKQLLPDYVLRAENVMVVIPPDAGEALTNPRENRTAQDDVERAIVKWGRFRVTTNAQTADLIITVRKGNKSGPIIAHSPADNRPVILNPASRVLNSVGRRVVHRIYLSLSRAGAEVRSSAIRLLRLKIHSKCTWADANILWMRLRSGAISRRIL